MSDEIRRVWHYICWLIKRPFRFGFFPEGKGKDEREENYGKPIKAHPGGG